MFVYSIFNQGDLSFIWVVFGEGLGLAGGGGQHTSHICTSYPLNAAPACRETL